MMREVDRRGLLRASAAALTARLVSHDVSLHANEVAPRTLTYKTVHNCQIKADLFVPVATKRRTIAVWIHGGALIMGDRRGIDRTLLSEACSTRAIRSSRSTIGWHPRPSCPRSLTTSATPSPGSATRGEKIVGRRAGADRRARWFSRRIFDSGKRLPGEPRPAALVSFWGYGDIAGPWYSRPDPFYRRQPLVSEAEARAAVGTEAIAEPRRQGTSDLGSTSTAARTGSGRRKSPGIDPATEPRALDRFCPLRQMCRVSIRLRC